MFQDFIQIFKVTICDPHSERTYFDIFREPRFTKNDFTTLLL